MSGFRKFLMRGNVIDLAVAVVVGAAFTAIVTAFVADLMTPLISMFGGLPDFSALTYTVGKAQFKVGHFLNALISFVIVAGVIYFFVVKPYTLFRDRMTRKEVVTTRECPACLSDIPKAAKRCAHCCVDVVPVP